MPFMFACATCGRQLSAREEYVGRKVKCPACETVLVVPPPPETTPPPPPPPLPTATVTATPPPPAPAGDLFAFDAPAPPAPPTAPKAAGFDWGETTGGPMEDERLPPLPAEWKLVSLGLLLIKIALYCVFAANGLMLALFGLGMIVALVIRQTGGRPDIELVQLMALASLAVSSLAALAVGVGVLLGFVGQVLCCLVPSNARGARGYAITAAACNALFCFGITILVAFYSFIQALKSMASSLRIRGIDSEADFTLTAYFGMVFIGLLLNGITLAVPQAFGLVVLVSGVGGLIVSFLFLSVVSAVREGIRSAIRRRGVVEGGRRFDDEDFDDEPRPRRRRRDDDLFDN